MRIVVVGGGIAGLAAAARLRELGRAAVEIMVIDQADQLGGKLRTGSIAGGTVETGAEAFLTYDPDGQLSAVSRLAGRVGLGEALRHPATGRAAITLSGQLVPVPGGTLTGVPGDLSTLDGVAVPADLDGDGGAPLLAPGEDVAVGDLVRRRLGDEVVARLVDPMLGGVYAGRADGLSLATTMPALHAAAGTEHTLVGAVRAAIAASRRPAGAPIFSTVDGGVGRLVSAVNSAAEPVVQLGQPVRAIARSSDGWRLTVGATRDPSTVDAAAIVLAVPARPVTRLLEPVAPEAAAAMSTLDYASVALVTLALPASYRLPELSGFLVPESEGYEIKAATFFTVKWQHLRRADGLQLVRASLGRYGATEVLQRTDAELVTLVREELGAILGSALPHPEASLVSRWGGALPQYSPGHLDRVAAARTALPTGLALAGAAFDGVGIAACVRSGESAADVVWAGLKGPVG